MVNGGLALLLSTSGTIGSPRMVRISYGNIVSNMTSICDYLHIDEKDREILFMPLDYTYALSVVNTYI